MSNVHFRDVRITNLTIKQEEEVSRGLANLNFEAIIYDADPDEKLHALDRVLRSEIDSRPDIYRLALDFQTYVPGLSSGRYPWGENEKKGFSVDHIFYDDVATVVFWTDGTKTVVRCPEGKPYDEYSAFCAALAKKIYGNNSKLQREIKKKARYSKKRQLVKSVCGEHSVREGNEIYPYKANRVIGKVTSVKETDNGLEVEVIKND